MVKAVLVPAGETFGQGGWHGQETMPQRARPCHHALSFFFGFSWFRSSVLVFLPEKYMAAENRLRNPIQQAAVKDGVLPVPREEPVSVLSPPGLVSILVSC